MPVELPLSRSASLPTTLVVNRALHVSLQRRHEQPNDCPRRGAALRATTNATGTLTPFLRTGNISRSVDFCGPQVSPGEERQFVRGNGAGPRLRNDPIAITTRHGGFYLASDLPWTS